MFECPGIALFDCCHVGPVTRDLKYDVDFINGGAKAKKLFLADDIPVLYWWQVFVAMQSGGKGNKTFVCPCRIKGTDLVLVYVLRTRCNKPHYDCLVYDIVGDKAFVRH